MESRSFKIQTSDKAASDGSTLSDPRMSGLKQKKAADGVSKKQRKSSKGSAAAAASKDEGGTTPNNNDSSNSIAGRPQLGHSSAASAADPAPSVSVAPVPSVRRGKCKSIFFVWSTKNNYGCTATVPRFIRIHCTPTFYVHLLSHLITPLQQAANESEGSAIPTRGRHQPPPSGPTSFVWECPTPPSSNSSWPRGSIRVCCTIPTRASIRPWSWFSETSSRRWMGGIWSGVWPWRRVTIRGRTGAFQLE